MIEHTYDGDEEETVLFIENGLTILKCNNMGMGFAVDEMVRIKGHIHKVCVVISEPLTLTTEYHVVADHRAE